jgi:hypothetical protein
MTDRTPTTTGRSSRILRSPMTVLTTTLAGFMAIFVMMTARVYNGTDPGLQPTAAVVAKNGKTVLKTTASGRVIASTGATPGAASKKPARLVTHASGSIGGGRDE